MNPQSVCHDERVVGQGAFTIHGHILSWKYCEVGSPVRRERPDFEK